MDALLSEGQSGSFYKMVATTVGFGEGRILSVNFNWLQFHVTFMASETTGTELYVTVCSS